MYINNKGDFYQGIAFIDCGIIKWHPAVISSTTKCQHWIDKSVDDEVSHTYALNTMI